MRLRDHREVRARRPNAQWRLAVAGGVLALLIGAACLAPLAGLGPGASGDGELSAATVATPAPIGGGAGAGGVKPKATAVATASKATSTPAPTAVPTPVAVPTLSTGGVSVLDSIRSDRGAQWVRTTADTPLRSGPNLDASVFTTLPQFSLLKQTGSQPDWMLVQYGGDGDTRQAGPGWVKASDVGAVGTPSVWLTTSSVGPLWSTSDATGTHVEDLPTSEMMEVIGNDYIQGTRVHVRLPGDGRSVPPSEGWIDGNSVARAS
ncbi:MAG TPA: hypothetical protein VGK33_08845, partial [Chloroflexota bacterium]